MAFKMKGWSAFTIPEEVKIKRSNQPKHSEVSESMYQAVEDTEDFSGIPDYEEKYTPEEIRQGAGSSKDFISTSSGRRGKKTDTMVGDKGKTKKKRKDKNRVKTNWLTGKKKMKIDTIDFAEQKKRDKERSTGEYEGEATAGHDLDWAFEGGTKQDKDISKRKRKAVFNPKTGKTEERYKSKFGIYRSTGRSVTDQAYIDAAKKKEQG